MQLVHSASQATNPHRARELARRALELHPDCADAFNLLGELADGRIEAADLFRQGIEAGRRAVGPERLAAESGRLGALREARPYLRSLNGLAGVMIDLGLIREAVTLWRELLRLDEADRLGARLHLAVGLLALEQHEELEPLLEQLDDGSSALPLYGRALLDFSSGREGADGRLQRAIAINPHVPPYLLGEQALPEHGPAYVGVGDESEAQACAALLRGAWLRVEGSANWLADQVRLAPRRPRRRRRVDAETIELPEIYDSLPRPWGKLALVARALEQGLTDRGLGHRLRARAAAIWAHYASERQPTVRSPGAYAAAVDYLLGRGLELHAERRAGLAASYGASAGVIGRHAGKIESWLRASPLGPELAPEWFEERGEPDGDAASSGRRTRMAKVIPFPVGRG